MLLRGAGHRHYRNLSAIYRVLIPWEGASDDHQLANAKLLRSERVEYGARTKISSFWKLLLEVSDMRKLCNNGGCDIKRNDICARSECDIVFSRKERALLNVLRNR